MGTLWRAEPRSIRVPKPTIHLKGALGALLLIEGISFPTFVLGGGVVLPCALQFLTYDAYPSKPSVPVFKLPSKQLSFDGNAKSTNGTIVFKDQFYRDKDNYIIAHSVTKIMKPYRFFG